MFEFGIFEIILSIRKIFTQRRQLQKDRNDENMNEDRDSIATDFSYINEDV